MPLQAAPCRPGLVSPLIRQTDRILDQEASRFAAVGQYLEDIGVVGTGGPGFTFPATWPQLTVTVGYSGVLFVYALATITAGTATTNALGISVDGGAAISIGFPYSTNNAVNTGVSLTPFTSHTVRLGATSGTSGDTTDWDKPMLVLWPLP